MALDRVVCLKAPYFHKNNVNKRTALWISFIISLTAALFAACVSVFITHNGQKNQCQLVLNLLPETARLSVQIITGFIVFLLPFLVLLFSNVIFVIEVHVRSKTKKQKIEAQIAQITAANSFFQRKLQKQLEDEKTERCYTKMLIILTTTYLVFSSLNALCVVAAMKSQNDSLDSARRDFFVVAARFLHIVNSSANLMFYMISGEVFQTAFCAAAKHNWQKYRRSETIHELNNRYRMQNFFRQF